MVVAEDESVLWIYTGMTEGRQIWTISFGLNCSPSGELCIVRRRLVICISVSAALLGKERVKKA